MGKKVLILSSSPRKGGNSETLAAAFAKGALEAGNQVETVYLREKQYGFCKGCLACQKLGHCVIKDDAVEIAAKIVRGQFYHQPCFGCREFPANFKLCETIPPCPEELKGERELGYILYDMDYSDPKDISPLFFRATLHDGVLEVPPRDSEEVKG